MTPGSNLSTTTDEWPLTRQETCLHCDGQVNAHRAELPIEFKGKPYYLYTLEPCECHDAQLARWCAAFYKELERKNFYSR